MKFSAAVSMGQARIPSVGMMIEMTLSATVLCGLLSLLLFYLRACHLLPIQQCFMVSRYVRLLVISLWLASLTMVLIPAFVASLCGCLQGWYGYGKGVCMAVVAVLVALMQAFLMKWSIQWPMLCCIFAGNYAAVFLCLQSSKIRFGFWMVFLTGALVILFI